MGGSLTKEEGPRAVAEGSYVFADLDELDAIIAEWAALRDRVRKRGNRLLHAIGLITSPAEDTVSSQHTLRTKASLENALTHNDAMRLWAQAHIDKLRAARAQYGDTETQAATIIRQSGEA